MGAVPHTNHKIKNKPLKIWIASNLLAPRISPIELPRFIDRKSLQGELTTEKSRQSHNYPTSTKETQHQVTANSPKEFTASLAPLVLPSIPRPVIPCHATLAISARAAHHPRGEKEAKWLISSPSHSSTSQLSKRDNC